MLGRRGTPNAIGGGQGHLGDVEGGEIDELRVRVPELPRHMILHTPPRRLVRYTMRPAPPRQKNPATATSAEPPCRHIAWDWCIAPEALILQPCSQGGSARLAQVSRNKVALHAGAVSRFCGRRRLEWLRCRPYSLDVYLCAIRLYRPQRKGNECLTTRTGGTTAAVAFTCKARLERNVSYTVCAKARTADIVHSEERWPVPDWTWHTSFFPDSVYTGALQGSNGAWWLACACQQSRAVLPWPAPSGSPDGTHLQHAHSGGSAQKVHCTSWSSCSRHALAGAMSNICPCIPEKGFHSDSKLTR